MALLCTPSESPLDEIAAGGILGDGLARATV
jgi:hypothetical protein